MGHDQRRADKEAAEAKEAERKDILQRVELRWPQSRFPRFPNDHKNLGSWEILLQRWPASPSTDAERQENEEKFWALWVEEFSTNGGGKKHLKPKQEILDVYKDAEVWIHRQYYAATGIYIEAYHGPEYKRLSDKFENARKGLPLMVDTKNAGSMAKMSRAETEMRAAREKFEAYDTEGRKKHFEKWGEWFFLHVEMAFTGFDKGHFGPTVPDASPNHPASDDLAY
jgi:hypothetical protein